MKDGDVEVINKFLDMCAESLSPDGFDSIVAGLEELLMNRHIDKSDIHKWVFENI